MGYCSCAAIPSELLEAELFGIESGVATGVTARKGKFQLACGGFLFLDEIGDMSLELQAKLLRALQQFEIHPLGARAPEPIDVRIITAALARTKGNRSKAAKLLGISRNGLALKILPVDADERTHARWLEEVRQGRRLSHPNLIRIFDVVETSDRPVAVMEFVPGGTLADRVVADGAQPVEVVIRWASEVLGVLAYLHEERIVHRDVKPSNLLVAADGSIKL